jgi:hypothetical protein
MNTPDPFDDARRQLEAHLAAHETVKVSPASRVQRSSNPLGSTDETFHSKRLWAGVRIVRG